MKKEILCLTGWGQKYDSLEFIFKDDDFDPFFVSSFNYLKSKSVADFFANFKKTKSNPEIVIGWSLGGQLAVRLIAEKIIQPKFLILIAPPFQMVKNSKFKAAMAQKTFDEFYSNFALAPDKTLKQFAILTAMNDKNAKEIAKNLDISEDNFDALKFWLKELENFTCFDINFSNFPKTLFFQGAGDMIVHQVQSEYFQERIANFTLEIFKNCGHAPQLNNLEKFREKLKEFFGL